MEKDDAEPDGLTVLMMSHYIGWNITLVSGKGEEWKVEDIADDVVLIYCDDYQFTPTDVGTCRFFVYFLFHAVFNIKIFKHISFNSV